MSQLTLHINKHRAWHIHGAKGVFVELTDSNWRHNKGPRSLPNADIKVFLVSDHIPCVSLSPVLTIRHVWVSPCCYVVLLYFLKVLLARSCIALTRNVDIGAVIISTID